MSKISIHLKVDESYIEQLMMILPKEFVRVVEKDFDENQALLEEEFLNYKEDSDSFFEYTDSMKNMDNFLKSMEK
jgi:hypothetical protein